MPHATDPLNHTVYVGSKGGFHYFDHENFNTRDTYRVSEKELPLDPVDVHPVGKGEPRVVVNKEGGGIELEHAAPNVHLERKIAPGRVSD